MNWISLDSINSTFLLGGNYVNSSGNKCKQSAYLLIPINLNNFFNLLAKYCGLISAIINEANNLQNESEFESDIEAPISYS